MVEQAVENGTGDHGRYIQSGDNLLLLGPPRESAPSRCASDGVCSSVTRRALRYPTRSFFHRSFPRCRWEGELQMIIEGGRFTLSLTFLTPVGINDVGNDRGPATRTRNWPHRWSRPIPNSASAPDTDRAAACRWSES